MAGPKKTQQSAVERFGGPSTPMGAALTQLVALREQYDGGESPETLELITLAETASMTINPVLIDDAFANQLTNSIQSMTSHFVYVISNPPVFAGPLDQFKAVIRSMVAIAGSRPGRAEAIGASLDAMSGAYSTMDTQRADIESSVKACNARLVELDAASEQLEEHSLSLSAKFNADLEDARETSEAQFETLQDELRRTIEAERVAIVDRAVELDDQGTEVLAQLRERLGLAADGSLSIGYRDQGDEENRAARTNKNAAVVVGLLAVVAAIGALALTYVAADRDWPIDRWDVLPAKLALVGALAGIAAYLAAQAASHRRFAQQLLLTALELNNIGGYLADHEPADRAKIRAELVGMFFGKQAPTHTDASPTTVGSLDEMIKLVEAFKRVQP
jgi:hypothetical protein